MLKTTRNDLTCSEKNVVSEVDQLSGSLKGRNAEDSEGGKESRVPSVQDFMSLGRPESSLVLLTVFNLFPPVGFFPNSSQIPAKFRSTLALTLM